MDLGTVLLPAVVGGMVILVIAFIRWLGSQGPAFADKLQAARLQISSRTAFRPLTICAVIALVLFAWMFRFELRAASHGSESIAYRLDRWTGQTSFCSVTGCRDIAGQ